MTTAAITYAAAVVARLDLIDGLTVLDGEVRSTPAGAYVVLYDDSPRLWGDRLSSAANRVGWTVRLVCVGRDANETRWVVGRVQQSLTNYRLDAARSAGWLSPQNDGAPMLRDESVPLDIRFSQTLTFRLTASRS